MKWMIVLAVVILIVPSLIWYLICRLLIRYGQNEMRIADDKLARIEPRRMFNARISHREIINVWTVLMLTPTDGGSGFYLKTTNRDLKEGDTVGVAEMEELPDLAELLRSAQVRADDEHGHFIFAEDYRRLEGRVRQQRREAELMALFGQRLQLRGLAVILPVCLVIAGALLTVALH